MKSICLFELSKFNLGINNAVSANCGIADGETKLPKSRVSNPIDNSELRYEIFSSVGMNAFNPCMASRGHSINFILSFISGNKEMKLYY